MSAAQSDAQLNAFLIVPKATCFLSLIGSSLIMWDVVAVYRGKRRERLSPRHRILAGMSFCDMLKSSGCFSQAGRFPVILRGPNGMSELRRRVLFTRLFDSMEYWRVLLQLLLGRLLFARDSIWMVR
jgi:hypothetical protein